MNNRQFHRVAFNHPAEIVNAMGAWTTQIIDISIHGALLACPSDFPDTAQQKPIGLHFNLGNDDVALELQGKVAHQTAGQLGIEFVSLSLESMTQLRQVISYNLGDETLLQRDISALISQNV